MNRRNAVTFKVPSGYKGLPKDLKAILDACDDEEQQHAEPCPQLKYSTLWLTNDKFQELCENSIFWNAMYTHIIISTRNFSLKAEYLLFGDETDLTDHNISNSNTMEYFQLNQTTMLGSFGTYLSEEDYRAKYFLTTEFIDTEIEDIKDWLITRNIDHKFDLSKPDEVLKEGVKCYYDLMDKEPTPET